MALGSIQPLTACNGTALPLIVKNNYMLRPSSGYYNFAQRVSYICLYCEVMLRSHHCYALQSAYLVGSLMANDWKRCKL